VLLIFRDHLEIPGVSVLHRQRRISHNGLRTVLSGTLLLERRSPLALAAGEKIRIFKVNMPIDPTADGLVITAYLQLRTICNQAVE
jgi:hypothetical protein